MGNPSLNRPPSSVSEPTYTPPPPPNPFRYAPERRLQLLMPQPPTLPPPNMNNIPSALSTAASTFIADHTMADTNLPHLDECPICLDNYNNETCLRITGIDGCKHHVGRKCLEEMLRSHPHEEKKCPLCRAVWIPAPARNFPPRSQSLATSRRMQGMFAGLNDVGDNIAGTQLGSSMGAPVLQPRYQRHIAETRGLDAQIRREGDAVPTVRPRVAAQSPIIIDSDSDDEEDYETQVQNFRDSTREIADIRRRARTQQQPQNRGNAANESGSNSDNPSSRPRNTLRSTAGGRETLSRIINPFRPTLYGRQPPRARRDGPQDVASRRLERARDEQRRVAPLRARRQHLTHSATSTPSASSSPPRDIIAPANNDIDMRDEVQERPHIVSQSALELDQRELDLDHREEAVAAREATLARRQLDWNETERMTREMVEMHRRHRAEVDGMMRRHREELESLLG